MIEASGNIALHLVWSNSNGQKGISTDNYHKCKCAFSSNSFLNIIVMKFLSIQVLNINKYRTVSQLVRHTLAWRLIGVKKWSMFTHYFWRGWIQAFRMGTCAWNKYHLVFLASEDGLVFLMSPPQSEEHKGKLWALDVGCNSRAHNDIYRQVFWRKPFHNSESSQALI